MPGQVAGQFTDAMFVGDQVPLEVSFDAAKAGLVALSRGGSLTGASEAAYGEGITGLARVGPLGSVPGVSRLVEIRFRELVQPDGCAGLALRWEAVGPGGSMFPALDADLTLTPAGENASVLTLAGTYRPPLGALGSGLDRAILHRVATATVRAFLNRVADAIVHPPAGVA
jgi:hypothetical protein